MYDLISDLIGHEWVTNYSGDQSYIYNITGAVIIILVAVVIDLFYRLVRSIFFKGGNF